MKYFFVLILAMTLGCGHSEKEILPESIDGQLRETSDTTECNVVFYSLLDIGHGPFVKINIAFNGASQTVLVDNVTLFQVFGFPRGLGVREYANQLFTIIEKGESLEVAKSEFDKLSKYSYSDLTNCEELTVEYILSEYFEEGTQKKKFNNHGCVINVLIMSNYQVWEDDYSGLMRVRSCG